jgi:hypothetical protein
MGDFDLYSVLIGALLKIMLGYLLLGLVAMMVVEFVSTRFRLKGKLLVQGLKKVIDDEALFKAVSGHPLIKPHGEYPEYMNFDFYSSAIVDCLDLKDNDVTRGDSEVIKLKENNNEFRKLLRLLIAENDSLAKFKKSLAAWFLDYMRNISGLYKRKIQYYIFAVSFILVLSLNINSIKMFKAFYENDRAKSSIAKAETAYPGKPCDFPFGWNSNSCADDSVSTVVSGLLISCIMVSISAFILFDFINRYVNIRSVRNPYTGKEANPC